MTTANMIENESFLMIAKHYAEKIKASGMNPTQEELQSVIKANWNKISSEIYTLTEKVKAIY